METLIRTFDPRATFLFGSGFWAVTVPFGWVPGTWNSTGTSPAVRSAPLASAASWPRTSGTVAGPFEAWSETVESLANFRAGRRALGDYHAGRRLRGDRRHLPGQSCRLQSSQGRRGARSDHVRNADNRDRRDRKRDA